MYIEGRGKSEQEKGGSKIFGTRIKDVKMCKRKILKKGLEKVTRLGLKCTCMSELVCWELEGTRVKSILSSHVPKWNN